MSCVITPLHRAHIHTQAFGPDDDDERERKGGGYRVILNNIDARGMLRMYGSIADYIGGRIVGFPIEFRTLRGFDYM